MSSQSRKDLEQQLAAHLERLPMEEALQHEDGKRYASVVAVPLGSTTEGNSKVVDQWQVVDSSVVAVEPDTWLSRIRKQLRKIPRRSLSRSRSRPHRSIARSQETLDVRFRTDAERHHSGYPGRCYSGESWQGMSSHT